MSTSPIMIILANFITWLSLWKEWLDKWEYERICWKWEVTEIWKRLIHGTSSWILYTWRWDEEGAARSSRFAYCKIVSVSFWTKVSLHLTPRMEVRKKINLLPLPGAFLYWIFSVYGKESGTERTDLIGFVPGKISACLISILYLPNQSNPCNLPNLILCYPN
jgi:hypothetical protein